MNHTRQEEEPSFADLPPEIVVKILGYVPLKTLLSASMVCHQLHNIASEPRLWRAHLIRKWRKPELSPLVESKANQLNWKRVYARKKLVNHAWRQKQYKIATIPSRGVTCMQLLNKSVVVNADEEEKEEEEGNRGIEVAEVKDEELDSGGWDLVSGDELGMLKVWSMKDSQPVSSFQAHDSLIWWLEVQKGLCVTACRDGSISVTNMAEMKVVKTISGGHARGVWCVDFSIEDDVLISGGEDGEFIALKFSSGEQLSTLKYPIAVFDVRYIPSTRQCLVANVQQHTFDLVSVDEGKVVRSFTGHTATISTIKVYGDYAISGADDETVRIWSLHNQECLHTLPTEGLVYDLRLCENKLVAGVTGPQYAFIRIWNFKKKRHLYDIPVTRIPTRLFSLSVLPTKIYCCTREAIHCIDFIAAKKETTKRCVVQ